MTANKQTSQRGTSWRRWFTNVAFRKGFDDYRAAKGYANEYDRRSESWQWMYEAGRLFAADPASHRYKSTPDDAKKITAALIKAYKISLATPVLTNTTHPRGLR